MGEKLGEKLGESERIKVKISSCDEELSINEKNRLGKSSEKDSEKGLE